MNSLKRLAEEVRNDMRGGNLVVFCGAGISKDFPSLLPDAWTLMDMVCCEFTGKYRPYIKKLDLRPEVLFQIISKYETENLINLLNYILSSVSFNSNHMFLSNVLSMGNNVITTNFDSLIEEACANNKVPYQKTYGELKNHPMLFKIHGSIEDGKSLMMTINHVHKGLSNEKLSLLKFIANNKSLLVLGYSGYDQLDIMPALTQCVFRNILWINHQPNTNRPNFSTPKNVFIKNLKNLKYIALNTNSLISELMEETIKSHNKNYRASKKVKIPEGLHPKVAIDVLMHLNEYSQVIKLISDNNLVGDIYFDINKYKAARGLRQIDDIDHETQSLFSRIMALTEEERKEYFPFMAQFATSLRDLLGMADAVEKCLDHFKSPNLDLYEAALEISFRLNKFGKYEISERLLIKVLNFADNDGNLLLNARANTIYCDLICTKYAGTNDMAKYYPTALEYINRAIFLLDEDIYNDKFYLYSAKHNKAMILRYLKDYDEAERIYNDVMNYFQTRNVGLYIQVLYNMAYLYYDAGKILVALKTVNKAINSNNKVNPKTMSNFMLGKMYQLKAKIMLERPHSQRQKQIKETIKLAIESFKLENNEKEILETEQILRKRPKSFRA